MSGHSKWSTIKRAKAANDQKRSKIFSKLSRALTIAAKQGGGDIDSNPALRLAVEKAKEARMPKENIDRAIKKGTGEGSDAANFFEQIYEGFGPQGEAFYIKVITDNRNRITADLRTILSRHGGSLGSPGSTAYIFSPDPDNPSFMVEIESESQQGVLKKILEDLDDNDDVQDIFFNFNLNDEDNEE